MQKVAMAADMHQAAAPAAADTGQTTQQDAAVPADNEHEPRRGQAGSHRVGEPQGVPADGGPIADPGTRLHMELVPGTCKLGDLGCVDPVTETM
jgi:hypothetical protein